MDITVTLTEAECNIINTALRHLSYGSGRTTKEMRTLLEKLFPDEVYWKTNNWPEHK